MTKKSLLTLLGILLMTVTGCSDRDDSTQANVALRRQDSRSSLFGANSPRGGIGSTVGHQNDLACLGTQCGSGSRSQSSGGGDGDSSSADTDRRRSSRSSADQGDDNGKGKFVSKDHKRLSEHLGSSGLNNPSYHATVKVKMKKKKLRKVYFIEQVDSSLSTSKPGFWWGMVDPYTDENPKDKYATGELEFPGPGKYKLALLADRYRPEKGKIKIKEKKRIRLDTDTKKFKINSHANKEAFVTLDLEVADDEDGDEHVVVYSASNWYVHSIFLLHKNAVPHYNVGFILNDDHISQHFAARTSKAGQRFDWTQSFALPLEEIEGQLEQSGIEIDNLYDPNSWIAVAQVANPNDGKDDIIVVHDHSQYADGLDDDDFDDEDDEDDEDWDDLDFDDEEGDDDDSDTDDHSPTHSHDHSHNDGHVHGHGHHHGNGHSHHADHEHMVQETIKVSYPNKGSHEITVDNIPGQAPTVVIDGKIATPKP